MRFWLHSTVKTSVLGQSTILSVVAHAALVVGAVYSTAESARQLQEAIAERVVYLPPPDRRAASNAAVERLTYIDVGTGGLIAGIHEDVGSKASLKYQQVDTDPGGLKRSELNLQLPSVEYISPDSVYSILEVDERAARLAGSAAPAYPADLINSKTEGGVFIRFVIDTTGRADPSSVEVLRSSHPLFLASVRDALPRMAFTSASVGGRKVRQAVEQNFEFKLAPNQFAPLEQTRTKPAP